MSCDTSTTTYSVNADLVDLISDSTFASQQLSENLSLPCPFSMTALRVGASVALSLHGFLFLFVCKQLAHLIIRFQVSLSERWWYTFAGRYLTLLLAMSGFAVTFTGIRLAGLSGSFSADGPPIVSVSFSPRAGATYGMSVLLYVVSISYVGAVSFSVNNTVHAALATGKAALGQRTIVSSLPWAIENFPRISLSCFVWNALVWCVLFLLPTAHRSSSPTSAQRAIALVLVSLGNLSYWILARFVTVATHSISNVLQVHASSTPGSSSAVVVVHPVQPSKVQPVAAHGDTTTTSGLNIVQVESRNRASDRCSMASTVVRNMLLMHVAVTAAFFVLFIALPSFYLQAYWIYASLSYWALVCLLRLHVLSLPQPKV